MVSFNGMLELLNLGSYLFYTEGRYTDGFLEDLYIEYRKKDNLHCILEAIRSKDEPFRATYPLVEREFKKAPLLVFKHLHYLTGGMESVANNIALGLNNKSRTMEILAGIYKEKIETKKTKDKAYFLTEETYALRKNKGNLTGEWIIFFEHNGKNYYLTLSTHVESKNKGDHFIKSRIHKYLKMDSKQEIRELIHAIP